MQQQWRRLFEVVAECALLAIAGPGYVCSDSLLPFVQRGTEVARFAFNNEVHSSQRR